MGIGSSGDEGADNRKETRQVKEKGWPPEIGRRKEFYNITSHHSLSFPTIPCVSSLQVSTSGSVPKNTLVVPVR